MSHPNRKGKPQEPQSIPPSHPLFSSSRKPFLNLSRNIRSMAPVASSYLIRGLGPAPVLLGRKDATQLNFIFFALIITFFFRKVVVYTNDLMPASDPNWARTGLQAEGDRWLELEIIHTEHGLARQPEVGHRNCNLLIVVIPGHNFHHITLVRGPLGKAQHVQRQHVLRVILLLNLESEGAGVAGELTTCKSQRVSPGYTRGGDSARGRSTNSAVPSTRPCAAAAGGEPAACSPRTRGRASHSGRTG